MSSFVREGGNERERVPVDKSDITFNQSFRLKFQVQVLSFPLSPSFPLSLFVMHSQTNCHTLSYPLYCTVQLSLPHSLPLISFAFSALFYRSLVNFGSLIRDELLTAFSFNGHTHYETTSSLGGFYCCSAHSRPLPLSFFIRDLEF